MIVLDPDLDPAPFPASSRGALPNGRIRAAGSRIAKPLNNRRERQGTSSDRLPTTRTLAAFLRKAQAAVRLRGQVTVLLTTDTGIRRLNRQFRGKNKATDVLSFPADPMLAGQVAGDLAISVATARWQAGEQDHALGTEIKVLILHGLLHLKGFDHESDEGQMARRERLLRGRLRLPSGLIERAMSPEPRKKMPVRRKAVEGLRS